jgi:heavy metal translocating P-type ATPase
MKIKIPVEGMHCAACVLNVENSLKKIEPIQDVKVSLDENSAYIEVDNGNLNAESIVSQIKKSGYDVPEREVTVKVGGMHCAACVLNVENSLKKVPIVLDARVNLDEGMAYVKVIPAEDFSSLLKEAVQKAGYDYLGLADDEEMEIDPEREIEKDLISKKRKILVSLPIGLLLMLGNHLKFADILQNPYVQLTFAFPAFIYAAYPILVAAWKAIRHGNLNMDVMYSMGMLVAFGSSLLATFTPYLDSHFLFYDTTVLLAAFLTIGRFLETQAKSKTSSAIKALTKLQPDISHRIKKDPVTIEFIYSDNCPHSLEILQEVEKAVKFLQLKADIRKIQVAKDQEKEYPISGSPTILVNGTDMFNDGGKSHSIECRKFHHNGKIVDMPTENMIIEKLIEMPGIEDVHTNEIMVGDILLIKAGEKVPVDGVIVAGISEINESMITGEPLPVLKKTGDEVVAGTLNVNKPFYMMAKKVGNETVLSNIIRMVRQAQLTRPPIQKLADKLVAYFIPIVLFIAIATFVLWYFILGKSFLFSLTTFISILVIACPCALGLATPTALTVGLGKAAELGILIKNADVLELSKKIHTIIMDKTGTITEGKPEVTKAEWQNSDEKYKKILKAMESKSAHPLAGAIVEYLEKQDVSEPILIEQIEEIPGKGMKAQYEDTLYAVGNATFVQQITGVKTPLSENADGNGRTIVHFASEKGWLGTFVIADKVKMDSGKAIQVMKEEGYQVVMVTGDKKEAAEALGKELGIQVMAEMKPEDKLDVIQSFQKEGKAVAFVGDGINDAPALTKADIGIAIGAGTDIARESGDIVLIKNSLMDVYIALDLGKKVLQRIKYNLFWAVAYNFSLIPIAAGYFYPVWHIIFRPEFAGLAMAMSSVSVVTLSLLLKRYKPSVR